MHTLRHWRPIDSANSTQELASETMQPRVGPEGIAMPACKATASESMLGATSLPRQQRQRWLHELAAI